MAMPCAKLTRAFSRDHATDRVDSYYTLQKGLDFFVVFRYLFA